MGQEFCQITLVALVVWVLSQDILHQELYPRHEKQTKNPAERTGRRYKIEILMSRTQKLKGLVAALLILKTLDDNPYLKFQSI